MTPLRWLQDAFQPEIAALLCKDGHDLKEERKSLLRLVGGKSLVWCKLRCQRCSFVVFQEGAPP